MSTLIGVWLLVIGVGCMLIRLVGILGVVLYARRTARRVPHRGAHATRVSGTSAPRRRPR